MEYFAQPCSRKDLERFASSLRKMVGYSDTPKFPIVHFLEWVLYDHIDGYSFEIVPVDEMPPGKHALAIPDDKKIIVREDIYTRAVAEQGRDRLTLGHELGHLLLHTGGRVMLARTMGISRPLKPYEDPEWQASAFAGELLIPRNLMFGKSVDEIMECCGVSRDAAELFTRRK